MLKAPFEVGSGCCNVMKKSPIHAYEKEYGTHAITATMACESRLRTSTWLKKGCNAFDSTNPISNPMSFWTEQDVLLYIKENNLPYCSVYGDIVEDEEATAKRDKKKKASECGIFDFDRPLLKTTGRDRTGCMFCGYGCHLEKEENARFVKLKQTHPKIYDFIMKPKEEGGLDYKNIIDWLNENGNTHIRY